MINKVVRHWTECLTCSSTQHHAESVPHPHRLQDRQQNGPVRLSHPGDLWGNCPIFGPQVPHLTFPTCGRSLNPVFPQGNKEVKSSKSAVADIPSGGTRNIKSMWEKGNIVSSSESPAPTVKVSEEGVGGWGVCVGRGPGREMNDGASSFPRMWRVSEATWLDGSALGRQSLQRRRRPLHLPRSLSLSQHRRQQNQQ